MKPLFSFIAFLMIMVPRAQSQESTSQSSSSQQLKHVDIYDHARYSQDDYFKQLPTHSMIRDIFWFPEKYLSPAPVGQMDPALYNDVKLKRVKVQQDPNNPKRFPITEAYIGPKGDVRIDQKDGKRYFHITNRNSSKRKNAVFNIEFEDITETGEGTYEGQIIMFIHDDSYLGYYFRRLRFKFDSSIVAYDTETKQFSEDRIVITQFVEDIPLSETPFTVSVDILERKVVLSNETHNIRKVYPVAVGAFEIQTEIGMGDKVTSMTHPFPEGSYLTKDIGHIKKIDSDFWMQNHRARTKASYFKGRPFIGVAYAHPDGQYTYEDIAFHYQIQADGLTRGFVSHGCVRVRDKDLYELEAIVFEGAQDKIPVTMQYNLPQYDNVHHPFPKQQQEYSNVYYTFETQYLNIAKKWANEHRDFLRSLPRSQIDVNDATLVYAWCLAKGRVYDTRQPGDGFLASVRDLECFTRTRNRVKGDVQAIIDYKLGRSSEKPKPSIIKLSSSPNSIQTLLAQHGQRNNQRQDSFTIGQQDRQQSQSRTTKNLLSNHHKRIKEASRRFHSAGCRPVMQNKRRYSRRDIRLCEGYLNQYYAAKTRCERDFWSHPGRCMEWANRRN